MKRLSSTITLATMFSLVTGHCFAKPIFIIRSSAVPNETVEPERLSKKPTEYLRDTKANNNTAIFYLPKTIAEVEVTYAIYAKKEALAKLERAVLPAFVPPNSGEKAKEREDEKKEREDVLALAGNHMRPAGVEANARATDAVTPLVAVVDRAPKKGFVRYPSKNETFQSGEVVEKCPVVVTIPVPLAVKFVQVPDTNLGFRADLGAMKGLVSDVNKSQITKNSDGTISGVDAEIVDRTLDIFEDFSVASINVGKKVMSMGLFAVPLFRTDDTPVYTQVGTIKIRKLVDIGGPVQPKEDRFQYPIDDAPDVEVVQNTLAGLGFTGVTFAMPRLAWSLDRKLNSEVKSGDLIDKAGYQGIVVREPETVDVSIAADGNFMNSARVYHGRQILAQTGGFAGVRIGKRTFSKAAQQITLSPQGAVLTVNKTTNSPLKNISGAVRNITAAAASP